MTERQPPYLVTETALAKEAPERWATQYNYAEHLPRGREKMEISAQLTALPDAERTPDRIAAIIGNRSWASIDCDQCGREVSSAVVVGQVPEYGTPSAILCKECLRSALALFQPDHAAEEPR